MDEGPSGTVAEHPAGLLYLHDNAYYRFKIVSRHSLLPPRIYLIHERT